MTIDDPKGAKAVSPADDFDRELEALFSQMDDVRASDHLKASTVSAIAATADTGEPVDAESGQSALAETVIEAVLVGSAQIRARRKAKWRAIRIAAIAACLVLALTGGVAYATPYSHVTVGSDGSSIDLGINVFGMTVSVESDDDEGRRIIDAIDIRNMPYGDSIERVVGSYAEGNPAETILVTADGGMKDELEQKGESALREYDQRPYAPEGEGSSQGDPIDAGLGGPSAQPGQPGPTDQPGAGYEPSPGNEVPDQVGNPVAEGSGEQPPSSQSQGAAPAAQPDSDR